METLISLVNHELPAWMVATSWLITTIAVFRTILSLWSKFERFSQWFRNTNRQITHWIRRWLGVPSVVTLTQAEYDALPDKDPNTLYAVQKNPTVDR